MSAPAIASITAIHPPRAVEGGRIRIEGTGFPVDGPRLPEVFLGGVPARLVAASAQALTAVVPPGLPGGRTPVRIGGQAGETAFVELGAPIATGLHQVDNPVVDRHGNLYVTYSGSRGQQAPVSIFRVRPDGAREPFLTGIVNPTSLAFDAQGTLHVSSRFEGSVYRVDPEGRATVLVSDLGIACGLAFGPGGELYVGDRSGTIFRVTPSGQAATFASLPPSIAAFHVAVGPDGALYVTAPTLATRDPVYRIGPDGVVGEVSRAFGRPQGLAFDARGQLFVVEALAGASGVYRVRPDGTAELVMAGESLVGLAFDPEGGLVVCSNETAYRLPDGLRS